MKPRKRLPLPFVPPLHNTHNTHNTHPRTDASQMRLAFAVCTSALVAAVEAERLYFLTSTGLSSVTTAGEEREDYNQWSGASAHCSHDSRGLGIDEIEGWASVTCGNEFFKANFAEDPTAPFELIDFGPQVKDSQGFYGTAINTKTHTAYVASYESSATFNGWKVRGNYLRGCTTVTSETYCVEKGPCYWINDKCLIKDKYTYLSLKTAAGPVGGGLYADEDNVVWISYNVPTGTGKEGGGYVSAKKDSKEVFYPHVHDTFPETSYGDQDVGYPQLINDALYVCSQTDTATELYKFDATHDPELILGDMPQFLGTYTGKDRPIRQPSFAVVDSERILQVNTAGIDEYSLTTHMFQTVISERNIGPLFYRLLPEKDKKETLAPGTTAAPTDVPATPRPVTVVMPTKVPAVTEAPGGAPGDTEAPAGTPGVTSAPAGTPGVTLAPSTTLAPGETLTPASPSPGAAPVQDAASKDDSNDDNSVGIEVLLIVIAAALLFLSFGLVAGFLLCKKNHKAPLPTETNVIQQQQQQVLYEPSAREESPPLPAPESPSSVPPSPHWLPVSDRAFSESPTLIQSCELSLVGMRVPAGEARQYDTAELVAAGRGGGGGRSSPGGLQAPPSSRRRSVTHTHAGGELSPTTSGPHSFPLARPTSPTTLYTPKERFNSVNDKARHSISRGTQPTATATLSV